MKKITILVVVILMMFLSEAGFSACPSMDVTGDCKVDFRDFAVFVSQWLDEGISDDPHSMVWVAISGDGSFNGEMSKYETTNGQYCRFLNAALASGDIVVGAGNRVYGARGWNGGTDFVDDLYFDTYEASSYGQISYSGGFFSVRSRSDDNGIDVDMSCHPVVNVSWYGSAAFCNYHGYRLPTTGEWQGVADYDGSYNYGCGVSIDSSRANYNSNNPRGLSNYPYTSSVTRYSSYGYGLNDMAGNVEEWTGSTTGSSYIVRGGGWNSGEGNCRVSYWSSISPGSRSNVIGFRVCRNGAALPIPDVAGMSRSAAEAVIISSRFMVGAVTEEYSTTVDGGIVISQDPTAGELLAAGEAVDLVVSLGLDPTIPDITWVYISASGVPGHEPFNGEMSKYEITNKLYCQFLNAALASGDIEVWADNRVYGAIGSNDGADFEGANYFETEAASSFSQITYSGEAFHACINEDENGNDVDMSNHPVVEVSWYGAVAYCNYYDYRLPTEWQWQAVAGYSGSYIYGCGVSIDQNKANYGFVNPLNMREYPYTTPVNRYLSYGYGMNDMAGNVMEWTDSWYTYDPRYRVLRGGSWYNGEEECKVSDQRYANPYGMFNNVGFRVCR